jgi:hypothetical protein
MRLKIKQTSWDLEDLKKDHRNAKDALMQADAALDEVETVIGETEKTIRQALEGQIDLDLEVIETARQFLAEQQVLRKQRCKEQQQATQRLEQTESRLKHAALYVKALEQIKAASDKEICRLQENQMAEQTTELWMQRYGQDQWQI